MMTVTPNIIQDPFEIIQCQLQHATDIDYILELWISLLTLEHSFKTNMN